ncbi:MAG: hypothetical protein IKE43_05755 [Coriobacteriales bacterium]|nr:hypothetical protein [Coriobacteriales bacterium]
MELYRQLKAKGMPKPAFRALQGAFYILNQTIVFGIYWKNGNYRVINRIRRSLIREIWHEEKLKSIPMLVRIAANIFNDTVIKRLKHHLFWKSSRFRKWMMLKKRHDR